MNAAVRWMPPEFILTEDEKPYTPTKEGDVWSFGMLIYVRTITRWLLQFTLKSCIQELWSGRLPYQGISIEKVSYKISRNQLPDFTVGVRPELEAVKEHVIFLCGLCWKRTPGDRVTASTLVYMLRLVS